MNNSQQLSITAEWQDAPLVLQDFSQSNKQKLSANVAFGLHSHPHSHQLILAILYYGVKLISSSQYFLLLIQNVFSDHISF